MADIEHATEGDTDLHGDTNAGHWAERFASKFTVLHRAGIAVDDIEGLMLTWFASAIKTGKMAARRDGSGRRDE